MKDKNHAEKFYDALSEAILCSATPLHDRLVSELVDLRSRGGRLFCLGVGGGAANAAHAVNDFRKLCGIECYAPTDSVSELTARANDDGWETIFIDWLVVSRLCDKDAIMVFSVGGGTPEVSLCIHRAVNLAWQRRARILGVVGRMNGITAYHGHAVVISGLSGPLLTPVTEAMQVAVLHALVSDPRLCVRETKW